MQNTIDESFTLSHYTLRHRFGLDNRFDLLNKQGSTAQGYLGRFFVVIRKFCGNNRLEYGERPYTK